MLNRLAKIASTNASLESYNKHVEETLIETGKKLEYYTRLNKSLQKDLEEIFRRLRAVKKSLDSTYPQFIEIAEQAVSKNAAEKGRATDVDAEDAELEKSSS